MNQTNYSNVIYFKITNARGIDEIYFIRDQMGTNGKNLDFYIPYNEEEYRKIVRESRPVVYSEVKPAIVNEEKKNVILVEYETGPKIPFSSENGIALSDFRDIRNAQQNLLKAEIEKEKNNAKTEVTYWKNLTIFASALTLLGTIALVDKISKENVKPGETTAPSISSAVTPSVSATSSAQPTNSQVASATPSASPTPAPTIDVKAMTDEEVNKEVNAWINLLIQNQNNPQEFEVAKRAWEILVGRIDAERLKDTDPYKLSEVNKVLRGICLKNHSSKNKMVYLSDIVALTRPDQAAEIRKTEDSIRNYTLSVVNNPKANDDEMLNNLKGIGRNGFYKTGSFNTQYVWSVIYFMASGNEKIMTPYSSVENIEIGEYQGSKNKKGIIYGLSWDLGDKHFIPIENPIGKDGNHKYKSTPYVLENSAEGKIYYENDLKRMKAIPSGIIQEAHQLYFEILGAPVAYAVKDGKTVCSLPTQKLIDDISNGKYDHLIERISTINNTPIASREETRMANYGGYTVSNAPKSADDIIAEVEARNPKIKSM